MRPLFLALVSVVVLACGVAGSTIAGIPAPSADRGPEEAQSITQSVTGTGVHFFTTAMIHSKELTDAGMIQKSTDIVELDGDLKGRILYHPTSVFDFVKGTLVNTGHQVFSGTILGSAPVMIHDDEFRFEVNLNAGTESGEVHLSNRIAGPKVRCDLVVAGTGTKTAEGNPIVDYSGTCTFKN